MTLRIDAGELDDRYRETPAIAMGYSKIVIEDDTALFIVPVPENLARLLESRLVSNEELIALKIAALSHVDCHRQRIAYQLDWIHFCFQKGYKEIPLLSALEYFAPGRFDEIWDILKHIEKLS